MAFFQASQNARATAPLGARVASSTGGVVTFTVTRAVGGTYQLAPHPAGYNTIDLGDTVTAASGNYNLDDILR